MIHSKLKHISLFYCCHGDYRNLSKNKTPLILKIFFATNLLQILNDTVASVKLFQICYMILGQFIKAFIIKIKEADGTCRRNSILQLLKLFGILKGLTKTKWKHQIRKITPVFFFFSFKKNSLRWSNTVFDSCFIHLLHLNL